MKYAITYKQDGLETPQFNMSEEEALQSWEDQACNHYDMIVKDQDGIKYTVICDQYPELLEI